MTYQELSEKINSPTLERDIKYFQETGNMAEGYTYDEYLLIWSYLYE